MDDVNSYLVGDCEVFAAFRRRLLQIAISPATVYIRGESGSGKGLAARALHDAGPRSEGPFVAVHLTALSPSLVESELFGHEQGAFTGAHRARPGRLRQADGGTLVLDDVDTLPADVQGKLVRVLQQRVVEPVGGDEGVPIDVRLISTSQLDLAEEVERGRFREDLYYRLAVVPLVVPPLRARLEDLPALCEHLTDRLVREHGLQRRDLSEGALERLRAHPWPGNVRELENTLERALVLAPAADSPAVAAVATVDEGAPTPPAPPALQAADLDFLERVTRGVAGELSERALAHGLTLEEVEHALLEAAFQQQRGNASAAARQVGLTRRAFEYRRSRSKGSK